MASFEKILKLDVAHEQSYIYLKCKQYDHNSRVYRLILTNEHIPIILSGTELVTVHIKRADGTYIDDVCQWKNGNLYLTMTDSMLAVAGDAAMEVKVFDGNKEILSTMTNHVKVERSMLPYDRMVASNEFNVLNHLIQSILNAGEYADELGRLLDDFKKRIKEFEKEINDMSNEGRALIEDLKDVLEKAVGLDEKLEQLDDGIDKMQDAIKDADTAKDKANEALTILNNIIEHVDNLDGVILSKTQPQDQALLGLWLVEEENGIKKVGQKIADNKNSDDYRFVDFAGANSEIDADGNVFINFSGEIIPGKPSTGDNTNTTNIDIPDGIAYIDLDNPDSEELPNKLLVDADTLDGHPSSYYATSLKFDKTTSKLLLKSEETILSEETLEISNNPGEENLIEEIQVNGTALPIENKIVNITNIATESYVTNAITNATISYTDEEISTAVQNVLGG